MVDKAVVGYVDIMLPNIMPAEVKDAILNEKMMTVHRRQLAGDRYETNCGHVFALGKEQLHVTSIEQATDIRSATKCGDCFEEGGGY